MGNLQPTMTDAMVYVNCSPGSLAFTEGVLCERAGVVGRVLKLAKRK